MPCAARGAVKVYPDFVFAVIKDCDGQRRVTLESKGDHLDNCVTAYNVKALQMLADTYAKRAGATEGELGLESEGPDYQAAVVLFCDMDAHLPGLLQPKSTTKA